MNNGFCFLIKKKLSMFILTMCGARHFFRLKYTALKKKPKVPGFHGAYDLGKLIISEQTNKHTIISLHCEYACNKQ